MTSSIARSTPTGRWIRPSATAAPSQPAKSTTPDLPWRRRKLERLERLPERSGGAPTPEMSGRHHPRSMDLDAPPRLVPPWSLRPRRRLPSELPAGRRLPLVRGPATVHYYRPPTSERQMTDARYPESWLNDRRIVRLSDAGHRLFVTALAWSASNRTDGLIEPDDLELLPRVDRSTADELTAAGLWTREADGWHIADFIDTQSTRAQLEALDRKRHHERERKAAQRARNRLTARAQESPSKALSGGTSGGMSGGTSGGTQRQGKDRQARPQLRDHRHTPAPQRKTMTHHSIPPAAPPEPCAQGTAARIGDI